MRFWHHSLNHISTRQVLARGVSDHRLRCLEWINMCNDCLDGMFEYWRKMFTLSFWGFCCRVALILVFCRQTGHMGEAVKENCARSSLLASPFCQHFIVSFSGGTTASHKNHIILEMYSSMMSRAIRHVLDCCSFHFLDKWLLKANAVFSNDITRSVMRQNYIDENVTNAMRQKDTQEN